MSLFVLLLCILLSPFLGLQYLFRTQVLSRRRVRFLTNASRDVAHRPGAKQHTISGYPKRTLIIGFFHPFCHAGGGGERVLWEAVYVTQQSHPDALCVIYQGDLPADQCAQILQRVQDRFGITLLRPVQFVYLSHRRWVEEKRWPHFTLLGQALGSMLLGFEAMMQLTPDIFIDTMGYAFTYPMFRWLAGAQVLAYTHYPMISTDMLQKVWQKRPIWSSQEPISMDSRIRAEASTLAKATYYQFFALFYALHLFAADLIMVNSTWTLHHMQDLMRHIRFLTIFSGASPSITIVYPPCAMQSLLSFPIQPRAAEEPILILSVAQFRPEKDHALQLHAFAEFHRRAKRKEVRLVLLGGCRSEEDEDRVTQLKALAEDLQIADAVDWEINAPYSTLQRYLQKATIGLHTMWNEHFGIGVVEYMAAGLLTLAHASGGPLMDILPGADAPSDGLLERDVGFLAQDVASFAEGIERILSLSEEKALRLRKAARHHVQTHFSDASFRSQWQNHLHSVLKQRLRSSQDKVKKVA